MKKKSEKNAANFQTHQLKADDFPHHHIEERANRLQMIYPKFSLGGNGNHFSQ